MEGLISTIRNTLLVLFFMLIVGMRLLAVPIVSTESEESDIKYTSESGNTSEIENPVSYHFLSIEIANCSQTITEVHRLMSVMILSNRIVPISHDFRNTLLTPLVVNFSSPVPIFIKGHALLN